MKTSIGTIPKKKAQDPVIYEGIEEKVMFSGNQELGENIAKQYMKAILSFQKLQSNLEWIGQDAWTIQLINEINEVKQVVYHLQELSVIQEAHQLVPNLPDKEVGGTIEEIYQPRQGV